MTTRSVGPGHGWNWLARAVNLGSHNPKALLGAAAILLMIAIVPTVVQLVVQYVAGADNVAAVGASTVLALLYAVLVMPPAMAGFLRVIHATETGAATRPAALLDGYRQQPGRVITLTIALAVVAMVIVIAIALLFGSSLAGLGEFMMAAEAMQGFQEFMVFPDNLDDILARLDKVQERVYAE